jgi:cytochrome c oxidase subunit 3
MMAKQIEYTGKVHPRKFSLWLLLLGILMLFAGLTSAYIVRKGDGNWFNFELPAVFLYSTIIVLLSSVSMIYAYRSAKQDELNGVKIGLFITILLGIAFTFSQYMGWKVMQGEGLYLVNPKFGDRVSASFLIVIAGVHLLHILAGILFLVTVLLKAFKLEVHKKNTLLIDMCNTYWHFVGLLWVYLYLFLYFAPDF